MCDRSEPRRNYDWFSTQYLGYVVGLLLIWHGSVHDNSSSALKIMSGLGLLGGAKVLPTHKADELLNKPVSELLKK